MSEVSRESVVAIEGVLDRVERALSRLADGTYRRCEACGGDIEDDLLVHDALRTTCAQHPTLED